MFFNKKDNFQKYLEKFIKKGKRLAKRIKQAYELENKLFEDIKHEEFDIAKEGVILLRLFRLLENEEKYANDSKVISIETARFSEEEVSDIKKEETFIREIHRLNAVLLDHIGKQKSYLNQSRNLTNDIRRNFFQVRENMYRVKEEYALNAIYQSIININNIFATRDVVLKEFDDEQDAKKQTLARINRLKNNSKEFADKIDALARKEINLEKHRAKILSLDKNRAKKEQHEFEELDEAEGF